MIENKEHKWSLEATENKVLINSSKKDLEPNSKVAIRVHGAFLFRTECMVLTLFFFELTRDFITQRQEYNRS
jgi:hypothetical protein